MALTNEEILNAVAEKTVLELVELISAFEGEIQCICCCCSC